MKKAQIYNMLLLSWLIFSMCASFTQAATPGYVGIENNDEYIWNTTYDEDVLEDYYEGLYDSLGYSEADLENYLERVNMQDDLVGIKIVVLDVDDQESDPWGEEGVRIIYNYYMMEEGKEWELEYKYETFGIWEYNKDIYGDKVNFATDQGEHFFEFAWKSEYIEDDDVFEEWKFLKGENPWFISTKVDWGEVVEELEEIYEENLDYDEVSIKREKTKDKLQITLDEDEDDDFDEQQWIIEYDVDGALMYYEWSYNDDAIVILEREYKFVYDNFRWIVFGIIVAVCVVIIIIVFLKK